ncbi:GNAT family N-acetyltransferase [Roseicella frigidaeris]|uniref:N-acetyltransferase domain-containing protein n=1 Tax=Roseicella frigidaeris TaxID=2230885 RepID=A0A327M6E0_9PROT|nr:GNAT family N-acetyltransferase [Roseicella frigidaeris]RAI57874.1 hypothetical protein DOO78_16640 [Roseicella frigidaeris]
MTGRGSGGGEGAAQVALRPGHPAAAAARARIHRAAQAAALPGLPGHPGLDAMAGTILHLHVAPPWQGCGIGGRLLAEAEAASPGGLGRHAFRRNLAARRFDERQGFRIAECREASAKEKGEPDIRYVLSPQG